MPRGLIRTAFLMVFASMVSLGAKGFDPIPPEVWAMKEDPANGVRGAVVQEHKVVLTKFGVEHLIRTRVLSEAGRAGIEIRNLSPAASHIHGRTSYRDGKFVLFDQRKDLVEKEVSPPGDRVHKVRVMVPPGVTADCVVEIEWLDLARMGDPGIRIYAWGFMDKLGGAFKTLRAEVEIQPSFALSYTVLGSPLTPVERQDSGAIKRFVFRNVPAAEFPPYSLYSLAPLPMWVIWQRPWVLSATAFVGVDGFWDEAGKEIFKRYFKDMVKSGSKFKRFSAEVLSGLPETPQSKAAMIQQRLDRRIGNTTYPTFQEKATESHKGIWEELDNHDLDESVGRARVDGEGMALLYLALLREAGIQPTLALVQNRWFALFNYDLTDPFQASYALFGIEEPGKPTLWVDPALRFAHPGMIQPVFQGTQALFLDTRTWKASRGQIPIQAETHNGSAFDFELDLGEVSDRFTAQAGFRGWDEWLERKDYMAMEPSEQARKLKDLFEKGVSQCAVSASEVRDALNPDATVTWKVEGSLEHAPGVSRSLDPFPGMVSSLNLPEAWPERRSEPILFDCLISWTAKSRIHVPKEYKVAKADPVMFANAFGRVIWRAVATPGENETKVEVNFQVDVVRAQASAQAYGDLKAFIDTVKKAYRMHLFVEKP